jgi:benzoate transport
MDDAQGADPRSIISSGSMTWRQKMVIACCMFINALDGFDVFAISFASPGISKEWGIEKAALGVVLSMELFGMVVGSIVIGQLADRVGRRFIVLGCLILMSTGMLMSGFADNIEMLSVARLLTGLGVGGMVPSIAAVAIDSANDRNRQVSVALEVAGYSLGGALGGALAAALLAGGDWRHVFWLGAGLTAVAIPLAAIFVPDSLDHLLFQGSDRDRLARVNKALRMLGHAPINQLANLRRQSTSRLGDLLKRPLCWTALLLGCAYFFQMATLYYFTKWIPQLVADLGYEPSLAGGVLVWANAGGTIGTLLVVLLASRMQIQRPLIILLLAACNSVVVFGIFGNDLDSLRWLAAVAGFCVIAAGSTLMAYVGLSFPSHMRAGGTGMVVGIGRIGGILGPIVGGIFLASGIGASKTTMIMALGSLVAMIAVIAHSRLLRADVGQR